MMAATETSREFWRDRLGIPNYAVGEAARYAHISSSTVGRWQKETTKFRRHQGDKLSYLELIEIAVVAACREEGMKLREIQRAHDYLSATFNEQFPFAVIQLKTDGVDLLRDYGDGRLLVTNKAGQLAWKSIIAKRFREFEYDRGIASRWKVAGEKSSVIIDPRIRFGAPAVDGVPTWMIRDRWREGEPIRETASEFSITVQKVRDALIFEGVDPNDDPPKKWIH